MPPPGFLYIPLSLGGRRSFGWLVATSRGGGKNEEGGRIRLFMLLGPGYRRKKTYLNLPMKEKQMEKASLVEVVVIWRNRQMKVEINSSSEIKELGMELVKLSNVKPETMKLLVPLSADKGSKLVIPFSAEHCSLTLQEAAIPEGKPIRMMGVFEREIEDVSKNSKPDLRIVGFDEEEKRLRKRLLDRPQSFLKLPQGVYIFCDFRTLHIPGIELNPPPSEALRRMHMLACDPGIIAIMNKHRWRVGIMTEMAPEGYVGISPKCLLGFNKNHGEEISLRLRTDDLKGLRKYESIKKTLLHELAHMVHSEHDANFFALNKQLNQEAESLDWTKSRSHTLSGRNTSNHYEDEVVVQSSYHNTGQKLGGTTLMSSSSARASSVAAAYNRYFVAGTTSMEETKIDMESKTKDVVHVQEAQELTTAAEPDPDDKIMKIEPDPDDPLDGSITFKKCESYGAESDPDGATLTVDDDMQVDSLLYGAENSIVGSFHNEAQEMVDHVESFNEMPSSFKEPDPDESLVGEARLSFKESDPNEYEMEKTSQIHASAAEPDPDDAASINNEIRVENRSLGKLHDEPDPDECKPEVESVLQTSESLVPEPYPDDNIDCSENHELMRIEESVAVVCERLQKAIETLRSEVTPAEATSSLQTLFKIIKNVIEHHDNVKFRRLRKGNPLFQSNVANHKAAVEVLSVVGFCEDVLTDEIGRSETYMVLKRNDPGLLWLAKSTLESFA